MGMLIFFFLIILGAIDDNGDYEHFVESVATTYDELSIEPPYEN